MADRKNSFQDKEFIHSFENFYKQAPQLPKKFQEILVRVTPWIALVFGVLFVVFGLSGLLGGAPITEILRALFVIVAGVLMLMAYPKVNRRQYDGWRLLFWVEVINFLFTLLPLTVGNVIGAILGALIGFYILFQIKSYYK